MKKEVFLSAGIELWGGIECSINRINDTYNDQLLLSGHYTRDGDIEKISGTGIKSMRYPVLWERHCPEPDTKIDWSHAEKNLTKLKASGITPIAGLVHHGSGPAHTNFYDGSFEEGLAAYAAEVAKKFPWIVYYTPVNEPCTTARFCGLYGHWYPHGSTDTHFLRILVAECKATIFAMKAIRQINPGAKLVQTEDLGKTHSSSRLKYQADFENTRRWLSIDLLCGKIVPGHALYEYILHSGIGAEELAYFTDNPCPPDILGINHYITSERFIDHNLHRYPQHLWGGNGQHSYADVEAVRVSNHCLAGPYRLLKEAWQRYSLPLAVTEVHLHCTREEQLRWYVSICRAVNRLKREGADIRAITAWAMLGSFNWSSLLTRVNGDYESGIFDIRGATPRPTALTGMITSLAQNKKFYHPILDDEGWWNRNCRIIYNVDRKPKARTPYMIKASRPILITGKTGTLGKAFARLCERRAIKCLLLDRTDMDIANPAEIEKAIQTHNPWAIINTAGFVRVDEAESDAENCFLVNSLAPQYIATQCNRYNIKLVTFSSDLVFNGKKNDPYLESDAVSPLSVYGQSKAKAEAGVLSNDPSALIIRTSAFFGPWDRHNFVFSALQSFLHDLPFKAPNDVIISPTYVPDLVNITLDLLLDNESGIWNISNKGALSWALLAREAAQRAGFSTNKLEQVPLSDMGYVATRPYYSVLKSEKGFELPSVDHALERFFYEQEILTLK